MILQVTCCIGLMKSMSAMVLALLTNHWLNSVSSHLFFNANAPATVSIHSWAATSSEKGRPFSLFCRRPKRRTLLMRLKNSARFETYAHVCTLFARWSTETPICLAMMPMRVVNLAGDDAVALSYVSPMCGSDNSHLSGDEALRVW